MSAVHDSRMPQGWHQIKCTLLTEMKTANSFHMCNEVASALFHARLIAEKIASESSCEADREAIDIGFNLNAAMEDADG